MSSNKTCCGLVYIGGGTTLYVWFSGDVREFDPFWEGFTCGL